MLKRFKSVFSIILCLVFAALVFSSCSAPERTLKVAQLASAGDLLKDFLSFNNDTSIMVPEPVGSEFFKNSVLVGDSITLKLRSYVTDQRNKGVKCLENAKFLCSGSMSYYNAGLDMDKKDSVLPAINGDDVYIEDGLKEYGAEKVFIMLGMNDFCLFDFDTDIENAVKLIKRIEEKNPGILIYIQSVTPILASFEHGKFTNENVDAFNLRLKEMCEEHGWNYIDVSTALKDSDNCLKEEYCSDQDSSGQGIHFTEEGCRVWIDTLVSNF